MEISSAGLLLIERFEGYRSYAYQDSVGVWTIGFGTTAGAGVGVSPGPGMTCTTAQAQAWLADYVNKAVAPAINATGAKLNQNQFDALCSLGYNLGSGCFSQPGWAVGNDLRANNIAAVSGDFMHYVYAGGTYLAGLATRRQAEQALFNTPVVAPKPKPSYHYDRFDSTVRKWVYDGHDHSGSERNIAKEYDTKRKHPTINAKRLKVLKNDLAYFVNRLDTLDATTADAEKFNRQWRHDQLASRAHGKVVKPTV